MTSASSVLATALNHSGFYVQILKGHLTNEKEKDSEEDYSNTDMGNLKLDYWPDEPAR